jgi:hypothetical protein
MHAVGNILSVEKNLIKQNMKHITQLRIIQFIHSTENLINQVVGLLLVECSMQKHERFFFYKLCNCYENTQVSLRKY